MVHTLNRYLFCTYSVEIIVLTVNKSDSLSSPSGQLGKTDIKELVIYLTFKWLWKRSWKTSTGCYENNTIRKQIGGSRKAFWYKWLFWLISIDEYGLTRQRTDGEEKRIWWIKVFHILKHCIQINHRCYSLCKWKKSCGTLIFFLYKDSLSVHLSTLKVFFHRSHI